MGGFAYRVSTLPDPEWARGAGSKRGDNERLEGCGGLPSGESLSKTGEGLAASALVKTDFWPPFGSSGVPRGV